MWQTTVVRPVSECRRSITTYSAYLDGSEEVQFTEQTGSGICSNPMTWDPLTVCTLRPPDYFEACLTAEGSEQHECMRGDRWFTTCTLDLDPGRCPE